MILLGAEQFLIDFDSTRIVWAGGNFGQGKTALSMIKARLWLEMGKSKAVISNVPCSYGCPVAVAPYLHCFVILDEVGVFFDSRSWAGREANEFRKNITAFLRKVNFYVFISSKVAPDSSLRPMWIARRMSFLRFGVSLQEYVYGTGSPDEVANRMGSFWLWGSSSLWSPSLPSPVYDSFSSPDDVTTIQRHFMESFRRTQLGVGDPNDAGADNLRVAQFLGARV